MSERQGYPTKNVPRGTRLRGRVKRSKPLIYKGLRVVVTVGLDPTLLTALRLFGQVRYSRDPRLGAAVSLLSSPRFRLASSATGGARLRAQSMFHIAVPVDADSKQT